MDSEKGLEGCDAGSYAGGLVWGGGLASARVNAGCGAGKHIILSTASFRMTLFKLGTGTINKC